MSCCCYPAKSAVDVATMQKIYRELADLKPVRFTARQLREFTDNFSNLIGSGGYGKVYEGELPNGVKIAVKVFTEKVNVKQSYMAEVGTIGRIHQKYLVRLYGFCYDQATKALVYEFMENGSLDKYLFGEDRGGVLWPKLEEIAVGTAKGLAYLHEECHPRIIHYDIKPANVLLDSNFSPKVADFGLANLCNADGSHARLVGCRGTPGYLAPEFILMKSAITDKCDVYSFGILLFEIVGQRRNARVGESGDSVDWFPMTVCEEYEKGELPALIEASGVAKEYREAAERVATVALWCVQDSPEARPRMSKVVRMLEGEDEIPPPPTRPFRYLFSGKKAALAPSTVSGSGVSSDPGTSTVTDTTCSLSVVSSSSNQLCCDLSV